MVKLAGRIIVAARRATTFAGLVGLMILLATSAHAQGQRPGEPVPAKVLQLIELLDDSAVQEWIAAQSRAQTTAANVPSVSVADYFAARLAAVDVHLRAIIVAIPRVPAELERAGIKLADAISLFGSAQFLFALALLAIAALAVAWGTRRLRSRGLDRALNSGVGGARGRLQGIALNLAFAILAMTVLAMAMVGVFMAFDWPPTLRYVVMLYLLAFVALNGVLALLIVILAPVTPATPVGFQLLRTVALTDPAARLWYRRLGFFAGWFLFGWATAAALDSLGTQKEVRQIVAYALGFGLVAMALDLVWRRPARPSADVHRPSRAIMWLATAGITFVWLSWMAGAFRVFWLILVAIALLAMLSVLRSIAMHLFRSEDRNGTSAISPVIAVCIERGARAVLIIVAIAVLMPAWGVDFISVVGQDTPVMRLTRGAFHALIILLSLDLAWSLLKAVLVRTLATANQQGMEAGGQTQRNARIRTLVPIVRNVAAIVLFGMGGLMALAALGVEIGPLVASAGVVGVAIGFGAQTMVRDIFSGIFYMLDDAFRVGEYIQSGNYKGVVDSFSLRSIKLRHHRGPLFTVPFGELGAIQNMSRDWVIDKMTISVAYGSNFDQAKKIIKQIGKELAQDPELGADILEPLKMQGVEEFGDYGISIRLKIMTKPGKQFVIRRRANAMIKKAFDESGIRFAIPIIHVEGGSEANAAAAHEANALGRPVPPKA